MLRQTSLGTLGLILGGVLTVVGLTAYFAGNPTLNLVGFFYGIPLLLGGLALKAAELKPVPFSQPTTPEVLALRRGPASLLAPRVAWRVGVAWLLERFGTTRGVAPSTGAAARPTALTPAD